MQWPEQLRGDMQESARGAKGHLAASSGGKLCIHPAQVRAANRHFSPSREEIASAQRVLAAADAAQGAAVALDGRMIDRPRMTKVQRIIAQSAHAAKMD